MLTAELVRGTRRNGHLHLTPLAGKQRLRAKEIGETYLGLATALVGATHQELKNAWAAVDVEAREQKLAAGLMKLVEDACEFEAETAVEPRALRSELFLLAAATRKSLGPEQRFDRGELIRRTGEAHGMTEERVEGALYSDLKSEHRLLAAPPLSAEQLLHRYDLGQLQAVLLRAVKVSAKVRCGNAADYRELFRKLKFRRLLFQIQRAEGGAYRIDIDGPFSLFESVTKYGLQLALMLPSLLAADELELKADLRWGKERQPLEFALTHTSAVHHDEPQGRLPDEVEDLLQTFREARDGWTARVADRIFDAPGVGLCVPDLAFRHASGAIIYLEVLGYWSRDAVWKRIELVQRGLPEKVLFAASQRLRVSEAALEDHPSGGLYVYKGALSARAVVEHLERLRAGAGRA